MLSPTSFSTADKAVAGEMRLTDRILSGRRGNRRHNAKVLPKHASVGRVRLEVQTFLLTRLLQRGTTHYSCNPVYDIATVVVYSKGSFRACQSIVTQVNALHAILILCVVQVYFWNPILGTQVHSLRPLCVITFLHDRFRVRGKNESLIYFI